MYLCSSRKAEEIAIAADGDVRGVRVCLAPGNRAFQLLDDSNQTVPDGLWSAMERAEAQQQQLVGQGDGGTESNEREGDENELREQQPIREVVSSQVI